MLPRRREMANGERDDGQAEARGDTDLAAEGSVIGTGPFGLIKAGAGLIESCEDAASADFVDQWGKSIRATNVPRYWPTVIWVRRDPSLKAGANGWVVARLENRGARSC